MPHNTLSMRVTCGVAGVICLIWLLYPASAFACQTVPLIFNARTGEWTVDGKTCDKYVGRDVNGRPTVYVSGSVDIAVRITEANPLLYIAQYGVVKVDAIEGLKELQALLSAAGGLITQGIESLARSPTGVRGTDAVRNAIDDLTDALRSLEQERAVVVRRAQLLETVGEVTIPFPTMTVAALDKRFETLQKAVDAAGSVPAATLAEIDKLLANHGKAIKAAAAMQLALAPHCPSETASCTEVVVRKVISLPVVRRISAWDRIATYPIKIARSGLFADDVVTTLPKEIETQVRIAAPQATRLGASVGIINTTVAFPTWSAVADPDTPGQKVITQTAEERFVAVPALIGTYSFSRDGQTALEFGTSLNTKRPAWFTGVGVSIGGALRLGGGVVLARTIALDEQDEGTPVADNAAIKTKTAWDGGLYFSFGLNLGSLRLFGG